MTPNTLIGTLFLARDFAHVTHLSTKSYAKHQALDTFYHEIVVLADAFAEAHQGRHGLLGGISLQSAKKTTDIVSFLEDQLKDIEAGRYEVCEKTDSPLQNILDEVIGLYLSTIYKLKFLS